jgi:limonene-1,2-epoxide hydrolase
MSPSNLVKRFLQAWTDNDLDLAHSFLSEDLVYKNGSLPPMIGVKAARQFAEAFGVGTRWFADWQLVNIAEFDDVVLTERIDNFTSPDGTTISAPLMGAFRVRNNKITEWRDYLDVAAFEKQLHEYARKRPLG